MNQNKLFGLCFPFLSPVLHDETIELAKPASHIVLDSFKGLIQRKKRYRVYSLISKILPDHFVVYFMLPGQLSVFLIIF